MAKIEIISVIQMYVVDYFDKRLSDFDFATQRVCNYGAIIQGCTLVQTAKNGGNIGVYSVSNSGKSTPIGV